MDATKRTQELTKQLTLSADQQEKVQGILRQEQTSMQNLHQDSSLSQQDRRAKMMRMMDIRNTSDARIRALLNELARSAQVVKTPFIELSALSGAGTLARPSRGETDTRFLHSRTFTRKKSDKQSSQLTNVAS